MSMRPLARRWSPPSEIMSRSSSLLSATMRPLGRPVTATARKLPTKWKRWAAQLTALAVLHEGLMTVTFVTTVLGFAPRSKASLAWTYTPHRDFG